MGESQFISVIRIWAAMAWVDGVVKPAEATAIRRLIDAADLTPEERAEVVTFLDQPVELDTSNIAGLADDARRGIYRAACRMAAVDREIAEVERGFLDRLRDGLGLSAELAREIEVGIVG